MPESGKKVEMTKQDASTNDASSENFSSDQAQSELVGSSSAQENSLDTPPSAQEENTGNWLTRIFSKSKNGNSGLRNELNDALEVTSHAGGDLTQTEKTMMRNILHLHSARVEDLMIPRAEIEAVELTTTLGELLAIFESSGHSRLPVFAESLDDPRGMLHIKDVMIYITEISKDRKNKKESISNLSRVDLSTSLEKLNITRKVIFAPPSMLATDLMAKMQATRTQIALVIDEYGGTDGLVSLEDIVEEIVGEIEDEHDDDETLIIVNDKGILRCDARAEIEDIREILNGDFDVGEHDEDADTIGGVIFSLLGRVPVKGEVVDAFGYEFRIVDADPRKIKSVDMVPRRIAAKI